MRTWRRNASLYCECAGTQREQTAAWRSPTDDKRVGRDLDLSVIDAATMDLADALRRQRRIRPNEVALASGTRSTTYGELDEHANRVANGLAALSLRPQTRVAMLDKNSDTFFEVLLGATKAGHVLAPLNWRLTASELAYIVNDAEVEVVFVAEEFFTVVSEILPRLPRVKHVFAVSGEHSQWEAYTQWRDRQDDEDPHLGVRSDDVVLQFYTSGTTGHPKGAQLTHANIAALFDIADEPFPCTADDVNLVCMPLFHGAGTFPALAALNSGAKNVIARETRPVELLRLIEAERVTLTCFVPALILLLLQTPECRETDFSSLKRIIYGASPIGLDVLREATAMFKCGFAQLYGLTETSGGVTVLGPDDHNPDGSPHMRSCGKPLSNVEIKVLDGGGAELPNGEVGEIVVRSPLVMKGYWKLPDVTRSAIHDGWFHTGDVGYLDSDGYLYIHDRVKDMIISGGENVYPAEVENVLYGHPQVADVAVIGVPDQKWGETVKAMVVPKTHETPAESDLIAYCRERLAHYKAPSSVEFVEALPRNASGKVLKRVLRAPYWQGHNRQVN
jgi:acyl-CoA synthetase (AMP-forming)/AMP-acid ligase II